MDRLVHIHVIPDFKPGDPPPEGYCEWHEWAEVQSKAGLKQQRCCRCSKWKFPQELSGKVEKWEAWDRKGNVHQFSGPICKECDQ